MKKAANPLAGDRQVEYLEIPVNGKDGFTLIITSSLTVRIEHRGCTNLAYVNVEADRYYCLRCPLKGRISQLWPNVQKDVHMQNTAHEQESFPF